MTQRTLIVRQVTVAVAGHGRGGQARAPGRHHRQGVGVAHEARDGRVLTNENGTMSLLENFHSMRHTTNE